MQIISTVLYKQCFILVKVYHRKMTYMMWLFSSKVIILICCFSAHLSWHPWYSVQQISQQLHWTVLTEVRPDYLHYSIYHLFINYFLHYLHISQKKNQQVLGTLSLIIKCLTYEAGLSCPSSVNSKNGRSYTPTLSYAFLSCIGTILPLP